MLDIIVALLGGLSGFGNETPKDEKAARRQHIAWIIIGIIILLSMAAIIYTAVITA